MREINRWLIDAIGSLAEGLSEIASREPKGRDLEEAQQCLYLLYRFAQRGHEMLSTRTAADCFRELYYELSETMRYFPEEELF